jgi:hypothetical protein
VHAFFLVLALGLGPSKALTPPRLHVADSMRIQLDAGILDPVTPAIPHIEMLGGVLSSGIVLGELHLSVDGQPSMPFLNPFFYAQEIRGASLISASGQMDPMSLATSLMATARIEF